MCIRDRKEGVFFVPNLDRVDCNSAEQPAAHAADVEFSVSLSCNPRLNVLADLILPVARLSDGHNETGHHDYQHDQEKRAPQNDLLPARHSLERLSYRKTECETTQERAIRSRRE